jgi:indolepyruvate ferredoxin oxidoreductase, alpha subunit
MAERTFIKENAGLRLAAGEEFQGDTALAVAKALLQSGVSYVSTYQCAPVSRLTSTLHTAQAVLEEYGVNLVTSANEAAATAALAASVNHPMRGAAIFSGPSGTASAAAALANLASSGVTGGTLIIVGEDYGEGSSGAQERSHALAMKSQFWLLDPRPSLPSIVSAIEQGFALSEASSTPVMLTLRRRACNLYGTFEAKDNLHAGMSPADALNAPHRDAGRIVYPPANSLQEKEKIEKRRPAAVNFAGMHKLNEVFEAGAADIGLIVQGGLYNALIQALQALGLADEFGETRLPLYVLNVCYPLIESEALRFCQGKRAVLMIEEGQPEFIEQGLHTILARTGAPVHLEGKGMLPLAGEYTGSVIKAGVTRFLKAHGPEFLPDDVVRPEELAARRAAQTAAPHVRPRLPTFCAGCPGRPVFTAVKLIAREQGDLHISCDVGCHLHSTLAPFNTGNTTMGLGLGGASNSALRPKDGKPAISILGDGGFWHNGLLSSIGNAVFNKTANVHIVVDNGYAASGGGQETLSSPSADKKPGNSNRSPIEEALRAIGVRWIWTMPDTYDVKRMRAALKEAFTAPGTGPKVIVARSECALARGHREGPIAAARQKDGARVLTHRFGTDPDICLGDHTCIRLSGCPSLTVAPNPDPLNPEPVTAVDASCTGCGLCGEAAHAAVLCPSYFRATVIHNPGLRDRAAAWLRKRVTTYFQRRLERPSRALAEGRG